MITSKTASIEIMEISKQEREILDDRHFDFLFLCTFMAIDWNDFFFSITAGAATHAASLKFVRSESNHARSEHCQRGLSLAIEHTIRHRRNAISIQRPIQIFHMAEIMDFPRQSRKGMETYMIPLEKLKEFFSISSSRFLFFRLHVTGTRFGNYRCTNRTNGSPME